MVEVSFIVQYYACVVKLFARKQNPCVLTSTFTVHGRLDYFTGILSPDVYMLHCLYIHIFYIALFV